MKLTNLTIQRSTYADLDILCIEVLDMNRDLLFAVLIHEVSENMAFVPGDMPSEFPLSDFKNLLSQISSELKKWNSEVDHKLVAPKTRDFSEPVQRNIYQLDSALLDENRATLFKIIKGNANQVFLLLMPFKENKYLDLKVLLALLEEI